MGGPGSGTWYRWDKRTTTEEVKTISVRYMRKHGLLRPGYSGSLSWSRGGERTGFINYRTAFNRLILSYRIREHGDEWKDVVEHVPLEWTPCHYGGERPWFRCPHCRKRVAVLYGAGRRFLCRHCYRLPYASQNESYMDRMMRKARKIRERLGTSESLDEPIWRKPKGMHYTTFKRLVELEQAANRALNAALMQRFGVLSWR